MRRAPAPHAACDARVQFVPRAQLWPLDLSTQRVQCTGMYNCTASCTSTGTTAVYSTAYEYRYKQNLLLKSCRILQHAEH